jgi:Uma2 family endonuclease
MALQATDIKPQSKKITFEEFLQWEGENQHVEWVDGEVVERSPVDNLNNRDCGRLVQWTRVYVEERDLGEIRFEPFVMRCRPGMPGRSPDIVFVAKAHNHRLQDHFLDGPADLAIEVISKGSRRVDSVTKFREYEQGGVKEYWLIDPIRNQADFFTLNEGGAYQAMPVDENGVFHSEVLTGFWFNVNWLWYEKPPTTSELMRFWDLL